MARELVCVVDEDERSRRALGDVIASLDLEVQVFAGAAAFMQRKDAAPRAACIVMSASLRGLDGLELQTSLKVIGNRALLLVVSAPCEASIAVRAMRAGALDFMIKPIDPFILRERVTEAVRLYQSRQMQRARLHALGQNLGKLTPRERAVLEQVMDGRPNTVIATDLGISTKTVEQHRARMMGKMKADSIAALVAQVTEWRLLTERVADPPSGVAGS
jgi:two-component system response regulator FixJ